MKTAIHIIEYYIKETGQLKPVMLGSEDKPRAVQKDEQDRLKDNLQKRLKSNDLILTIAIILLCVIFVIGVFFVIYYKDNPKTIGVVFGGTFLSLLTIVLQLRKIWLDKNILDVSLNVIENLQPEDAADFIKTLYWNLLKNRE